MGISAFWRCVSISRYYFGEMDSWDGGEHLWKTFSSVRISRVHRPDEKVGTHLGANRIRHWMSCDRNTNLRYLESNRHHQIQTTETKLKNSQLFYRKKISIQWILSFASAASREIGTLNTGCDACACSTALRQIKRNPVSGWYVWCIVE